MTKKIQGIIRFLQHDIWRVRAKNLPRTKSILLNQLRTILIAVRGFNEDKCQLRAAALTFYSLLSVVPVFAMLFVVAKGLGFEKRLEEQLLENMQGQEEVATQLIGFAKSFLDNLQSGVVFGIGFIILFWTIIKVLGNIESSFNGIWGIKKGRSLARKFSDYLSIMLICPVLLIMSSSITVLITSQVKLIMEKIELLGVFSPVIMTLLKILPYGVTWVLFTFIYMFMPNTKVKIRAGLIGGVIAGTIYQIVQWAYITFQIGASKYGAIYGSFAALPLFLIWLQVSWLIVLFGAEISFAEQNVDTYEFEPDCLKVSRDFQFLMALRIAQLCVKDFHEGRRPRTASQIAHDLEAPIRLVRELLYELTEAGILNEVKRDENGPPAYQPAQDLDKLSVASVLQALKAKGIEDIPVAASKELDKLKGILKEFERQVIDSPANVLLKNI